MTNSAAGTRSAPALTREAPPSSPLVSLSGMLAALNAAGLGLLAVTVLVLVGWATAPDSEGSATQAMGAAVQVWLVGHGARLALMQGEFGLVPLGLTALPAALVFVSARRAARTAAITSARDMVALTSVVTAAYAVLAAGAAVLSAGDASRAGLGSAFLGAAGLALVAGGTGVLSGTGRTARLWRRMPVLVRLGAVGGGGALAVLVAGGALLAGAALIRHHGRTTTLTDGLDTGVSGALLLLLLGVLYAPTAVVWAVAYVLGPGFAVGSGTSVAMSGVDLGAVPAFPLLGALPSEGAGAPLAYSALVVPVAAGAVAAALVERGARASHADLLESWKGLASLGSAVGLATGAVVGVLALLASGPAGPGRLEHVGPQPLWTALTAAVELAVVVAASLAVRRLRRR